VSTITHVPLPSTTPGTTESSLWWKGVTVEAEEIFTDEDLRTVKDHSAQSKMVETFISDQAKQGQHFTLIPYYRNPHFWKGLPALHVTAGVRVTYTWRVKVCFGIQTDGVQDLLSRVRSSRQRNSRQKLNWSATDTCWGLPVQLSREVPEIPLVPNRPYPVDEAMKLLNNGLPIRSLPARIMHEIRNASGRVQQGIAQQVRTLAAQPVVPLVLGGSKCYMDTMVSTTNPIQGILVQNRYLVATLHTLQKVEKKLLQVAGSWRGAYALYRFNEYITDTLVRLTCKQTHPVCYATVPAFYRATCDMIVDFWAREYAHNSPGDIPENVSSMLKWMTTNVHHQIKMGSEETISDVLNASVSSALRHKAGVQVLHHQRQVHGYVKASVMDYPLQAVMESCIKEPFVRITTEYPA